MGTDAVCAGEKNRAFVSNHCRAAQAKLADALGINAEAVKKRGEQLHEVNPMMGHRGVRLGVTYPEDKARVAEGIRELIRRGVYPENLWGRDE